jgi:hypothetical protein
MEESSVSGVGMSLLGSKTVLVVDDEPMLREILRDVFELEGATVFEASNGTEAFELLQHESVHVVVSDIRMPGGDGIELLRNLRKRESNTPVVLLITGFTDLSTDAAYDIGADAILSKPFDVSELLERVIFLMKQLEDRLKNEPTPLPAKVVDIKSMEPISIGRGGVYIENHVEYSIGDSVQFEVKDHSSSVVLQGCGIVRWVRKNASDSLPKGTGIEFTYLKEASMGQFKELLGMSQPKAFIPKMSKGSTE